MYLYSLNRYILLPPKTTFLMSAWQSVCDTVSFFFAGGW